MGYVNRHVYDVRCGCKACTSHELALADTIRGEPEFLPVHTIRFTTEYWDYLRATDPIGLRSKPI